MYVVYNYSTTSVNAYVLLVAVLYGFYGTYYYTRSLHLRVHAGIYNLRRPTDCIVGKWLRHLT